MDPALKPEPATLISDPSVGLLRPVPLTRDAIRSLVTARLSGEPHDRFVDACNEVTGGNPFLLGELLDEAAACHLDPTAAAADVSDIVPRGVANSVLLRLTRLPPAAAALARAPDRGARHVYRAGSRPCGCRSAPGGRPRSVGAGRRSRRRSPPRSCARRASRRG